LKKLAIVGTAPSSIHLAPYNNPEYEIWGLNGVYGYIDFPNITNIVRWFEVHGIEIVRQIPGYYEWLQGLNIPVYMQEPYPDFPTAKKYPLEKILQMFPRRYFNNSISYMIALAVHEGYTDISLFGVDMATDSEYSNQRPSCEYMIGYCEGKGINFYLPPESDLLRAPFLYGFEEEKINAMRSKLLARKQELEQKKAEATQQANMATATLNTYDGALQDVEYMLKSWAW
jgi:hypothetical protein